MTCPICKQPLPLNAPTEVRTFPFCSERCQTVDLARWADGRYQIVEELDPQRLAAEMESQQEFDPDAP